MKSTLISAKLTFLLLDQYLSLHKIIINFWMTSIPNHKLGSQ